MPSNRGLSFVDAQRHPQDRASGGLPVRGTHDFAGTGYLLLSPSKPAQRPERDYAFNVQSSPKNGVAMNYGCLRPERATCGCVCAMMRRPEASMTALILPVRLRAWRRADDRKSTFEGHGISPNPKRLEMECVGLIDAWRGASLGFRQEAEQPFRLKRRQAA